MDHGWGAHSTRSDIRSTMPGRCSRATGPCRFRAARRPRFQRSRFGDALTTGVKAIDLFTPICAGQRIGIFAGSGVGKSTLLAMLSRAPSSDVTVLALVGERSREVRDFLDDTLSASRSRVVSVVATSDESPMMRRLAPSTACALRNTTATKAKTFC